jgi:DNA-binding ferritin-like protein
MDITRKGMGVPQQPAVQPAPVVAERLSVALIRPNVTEATFKKSPYGRTAASQQRAKELLNPPKPPEPNKDEKADEGWFFNSPEEKAKKKEQTNQKLKDSLDRAVNNLLPNLINNINDNQFKDAGPDWFAIKTIVFATLHLLDDSIKQDLKKVSDAISNKLKMFGAVPDLMTLDNEKNYLLKFNQQMMIDKDYILKLLNQYTTLLKKRVLTKSTPNSTDNTITKNVIPKTTSTVSKQPPPKISYSFKGTAKEDQEVAEKMMPASNFAGTPKHKLGSAGQLKGKMKRPARAGDLVGGGAEESVQRGIKVSEGVENIMDSLINKIIANEAIQNNK